MKNSNLKKEISREIDEMISKSCIDGNMTTKFKNLHIAIVKKYYNAADVNFDYHRKRVEMDIVMDDMDYDPKMANVYLPTFQMNLIFKDLCNFLKSCLDNDDKSLAFYSSLLQSLRKKEESFSLF